ncbi:Transposase tnp2 [Gracilaria domingensis]|nr:Transposase tnp2 [Gracilaria domingensis]
MAHRRAANIQRERIGRGLFKKGFSSKKLSMEDVYERFKPTETLSEHGTDDEFPTAWKSCKREVKKSKTDVCDGFITSEHAVVGQTSLELDDDPVVDNFSVEMPQMQMNEPVQGNTIQSQDRFVPTNGDTNNSEGCSISSDLGSLEYGERVENVLDSGDDELEEVSVTLQWIQNNKDVLKLFVDHALAETVMNDVIKLPGIEAPCKSWRTILRYIELNSGIGHAVDEYSVCEGHCAFTSTFDEVEPFPCSICGKQKPTEVSVSGGRFSYLSLFKRISLIVANERACNKLYEYRWNRRPQPGVMRDYLDGSFYQSLCDKYGGEENLRYDLFFAVSTDGFEAFRTGHEYSCWVVPALNLNLPPDERYAAHNIIPLMFIPGPGTPRDLVSFLKPVIAEFQESHDYEMSLMTFFDGEKRCVRFHMVYFSGDQPAIAKVAGLQGHNGKSPCRNCRIHGIYSEESRHYYYPSRIMTKETPGRVEVLYDPACLPIRSASGSFKQMDLIQGCKTKKEMREMQTFTGISGRSSIFKVPGLVPFVSFPNDPMHLFTNVGKSLMFRMMKTKGESFSLSDEALNLMDASLLNLYDCTSSMFLAEKHGALVDFSKWKANATKQFFSLTCLVVLDGYVSNPVMEGLYDFSRLVELCFRSVVTREDIDDVRILAVSFFQFFEKEFVRYNQCRINWCLSVFHSLLHLHEDMRRYGPLIGVSQYWVERYIGWNKNRLTSRQRAAESMFLREKTRESYKYFYEDHFSLPPVMYHLQNTTDFSRLKGPSRLLTYPKKSRYAVRFRKLFSNYLRRKFIGICETDVAYLCYSVTKVVLWCAIEIYDNVCGKQKLGGCFNLSGKSRNKQKRWDWVVSVEMDTDELVNKADVYYGRVRYIMELDLSEFEGKLLESRPSLAQKHVIVDMDWAQNLRVGLQGQIYSDSTASSTFTSPSFEDVSIIRRLIGVMERPHKPYGKPGPPRRRTYFLDRALRVHKLLDSDSKDYEGMNRILRGMVGDKH